MESTEELHTEMVIRLFKRDGFHHQYDGLLHSIIGLSSEVEELRIAISNADRKNIIEELGDISFYLSACIQQTSLNEVQQIQADLLEKNLLFINNLDIDIALSRITGVLFDLVKRGWANGKDIDYPTITIELLKIGALLDDLLDTYELDFDDILVANMKKLEHADTGRYTKGIYSDAEANARNDKLTGE